MNNAIHAVPMNELEAMKKGINDLYALVAQERLRNDANSREPTTKKEYLLTHSLMMICVIKEFRSLQQ